MRSRLYAKELEIRKLEQENAVLRCRLDSSPGWAPGGSGETLTAAGGGYLKARAAYSHHVSGHIGLLLVNEIHKDRDKNKPGQRFNPSEMAWQSFLLGAERDRVKPSRLRYIVVSHIINEDTKAVIFETTRVSISTLFLRVSGAMHGRIVGIDETHIAVQQAIQKLDRWDFLNNVAFICGNTHHLDTINGRHDAGHFQTTFDIIFARIALPPSLSQYETLLRL